MAKSNDSTETTILDEVDDGEPILLDDSEVTEGRPETLAELEEDLAASLEIDTHDSGGDVEDVQDTIAPIADEIYEASAAYAADPRESFGQWVTIESATLLRGERDKFTITHPQPGAHGLWYLNEHGKEGFVAWSCGVQLVDVKRSIEPNLFG